ncbi:hypothetical protein BpHYR1_009648 [Brachionus plicatilis]|uniref:Uncharacterized protein n=1 Tax=Brachionus plicatilis TaxID=10195 RepID=A0A3M7S9X8_BRAPC|nr:hypothetical protein BpHYR1_009648 [Brachionus plicatilis]
MTFDIRFETNFCNKIKKKSNAIQSGFIKLVQSMLNPELFKSSVGIRTSGHLTGQNFQKP